MVGQVMQCIFLENNFQNKYLIVFSFGKPDSLKIILVSFFKNKLKKIGREVIRWIIKKSGFFCCKIFFNLKKLKKNK